MKIAALTTIASLVCTTVAIQTELFTTEIYSVARNTSYARNRRASAREDRNSRHRTNRRRKSGLQGSEVRDSGRSRYETNRRKNMKEIDEIEDDGNFLAPTRAGRVGKGKGRYGSGLSAWDWNELLYLTDLEVGNPPQKLRALLSISENDMFVPSAYCTNTYACKSHQLYNVSMSRTQVATNDSFEKDYSHCSASGNLTFDTIKLAGLDITDQQFGTVDSLLHFDTDWGNKEWDGLLGLAPSSSSTTAIKGPFLNMISQNILSVCKIKTSTPHHR